MILDKKYEFHFMIFYTCQHCTYIIFTAALKIGQNYLHIGKVCVWKRSLKLCGLLKAIWQVHGRVKVQRGTIPSSLLSFLCHYSSFSLMQQQQTLIWASATWSQGQHTATSQQKSHPALLKELPKLAGNADGGTAIFSPPVPAQAQIALWKLADLEAWVQLKTNMWVRELGATASKKAMHAGTLVKSAHQEQQMAGTRCETMGFISREATYFPYPQFQIPVPAVQ